jgi:iron complex transport system ATP-binding protein
MKHAKDVNMQKVAPVAAGASATGTSVASASATGAPTVGTRLTSATQQQQAPGTAHTLVCKNLTIGYNRRPVLRDISISVSSGEVLCLLGPNGVGKSTLFKTMLQLLPKIGGEVLVDGQPAERMARREFAHHVAYVPQNHSLAFPYSVINMVLTGAVANLGAFQNPGRREYELAEDILQTLGIKHLKERNFTELSGGEQQMTLIARAMMQDADIVLMDEPTAALDIGNSVAVLDTVRRTAGIGRGVIMVTHDPDQCFLCASKVVLITYKNEVFAGPVDKVITEANLKRAYGIDTRIVETTDATGKTLKACVPLLSS